MKRVLVKSVFDAFDYVMQHYYPAGLEELVEKSDSFAVISIQDSHTNGFGIRFTENQFCKGVLTLQFDDIVSPVEGAVLFSESMAAQIIRFIREYKFVDTLLIHCYAGQSRSRAVGAFAVKMLGRDNSLYFAQYSPNTYVYDILEKCWEEEKNKNDSGLQINSILSDIMKRNTKACYSADTLPSIEKMLVDFCNSKPEHGKHIDYLIKASELLEIYDELESITEEEHTPENEQYIAELADEISEICAG